jgi:ADP-heptose:LPS heptosyltransferase
MRALGLGDVLMCTPALRELKQRSPTCRVTCYTELTSLVSGLPFIDDVRPMVELPETFIRNVATRS